MLFSRKSSIYVVLFILSLTYTNNSYAQHLTNSIEEYRKRIQQNVDNYSSIVQSKYSDYLRGIWERYKAYAPLSIPDEDIAPVIYEKKDSLVIKEIPIDKHNLLSIELLDNSTPSPIHSEVKDTEYDEDKKVTVLFYNNDLQIHAADVDYDLNNTSNQSIADVWDNFCENTHLKMTLYDCLSVREERNLCDWAYLNLIHKVSQSLCSNSNNVILLTTYLLEQSGYDIKIGRRNDKLHLLFSSEYEIYGRHYFVIDNIKYYLYEEHDIMQEMEICVTPRISLNSVSMAIDKEQMFNTGEMTQRNIAFMDSYAIDVPVNQNLLDFYSTYPTSRINGNDMTRWALYAQTPMNETIRNKLYVQLSSLIEGKNEQEAANILLKFVQTGLVYKYDDEVWGEDRAFFAEESLAYPYSDCEDRSILFSHLIRDLLELEVALVYSPGHLFTAVRFANPIDGSYFLIDNKKYTVCEPTCITGAPVGWSAVKDNTEGIELYLLSKINYGKSYKTYSKPLSHSRSLFPICINGKYGYKNINDEIVVPCEFDDILDSKLGDKFLYGLYKSGRLFLYDDGAYEVLQDVDGYIPLELNRLKDGVKGDFFAIVKLDGAWYFVDLILGPHDTDFCFNEYDMEEVSYENNIYCKPQSEKLEITKKFIILRKKENNKYGVLCLNSGTCILPFEYEKICFVENDKSKVKVYEASGDYKIVSLN